MTWSRPFLIAASGCLGLAAMADAAGREPARRMRVGCAETVFPAAEGRSLLAVLEGMATADHFEVYDWAGPDVAISHAGGTSLRMFEFLSNRVNLIAQYRYDSKCRVFEIDKLWLLPVGQAAKPVPVAPPPPPPPPPAVLLYLNAHGAASNAASSSHP